MLAHPALRRWLDRTLGAVEGATVERLRLAPQRPPLFVVGPPRSGTTALFLTLVNGFRLAWLPNLSKRHPRAPFGYALLGSLGARYRPTLANHYGTVDQPMAPSDGWAVFGRWLPEGDPAEVARQAEPLRTLLRLFELLHGGPFCVRNNVLSLRIPALRRLFPDALFVATRRDWRETALSLAEAYRVHATPRDAWWSAGPPDLDPAAFHDPLEKAVFQTLGVEAVMQRDLARLPGTQRLRVGYDALCEAPEAVRDAVAQAYRQRGVALERRRDPASSDGLRRSARGARIAAADRARLERYRERFLRCEAGAPAARAVAPATPPRARAG